MNNVRQSIDNLHDDILRSVLSSQKQGSYGKVIDVIDPSPGLFGGEPIEGLVSITYQCPLNMNCGNGIAHTHGALFGPYDEVSRPSWEVDHFSLYAD